MGQIGASFAARLIAVLVVALASAAYADARALQRIGAAYSPMVTDGERYAAYAPDPGTFTLRDTRTGREHGIAAAAGCQPAWSARTGLKQFRLFRGTWPSR